MCPEAHALRGINANGTPVCVQVAIVPPPPPPPSPVTITTLDSGDVGVSADITIGADGFGLISYFDTANGALKVARCNDTKCTTATLTTLDSGDVGLHTSITVGGDGYGLISYYDYGNRALKVAHCTNVACSSATTTTVDSVPGLLTGLYSSITTGADGLGLIGYQERLDEDLKVAHCDNPACTSATITTLDTADKVGQDTSITIGADGLGLITYYDDTNLDVKIAHCQNTACTSATVQGLGLVAFPWGPSIATGHDGRGLVSFYVSDMGTKGLWTAHCDYVSCEGQSLALLDPVQAGPADGVRTSTTIGGDHLGLVSYYDPFTADLKVGHCTDAACTSAAISTVDSTGSVGRHPSITTGADGFGLVAYYDLGNGALKVAHCGNAKCGP